MRWRWAIRWRSWPEPACDEMQANVSWKWSLSVTEESQRTRVNLASVALGIAVTMLGLLCQSTAATPSAHAAVSCARMQAHQPPQQLVLVYGAPARTLDLNALFGCSSSTGSALTYSINPTASAPDFTFAFDDAAGTVTIAPVSPAVPAANLSFPVQTAGILVKESVPPSPGTLDESHNLQVSVQNVDDRVRCTTVVRKDEVDPQVNSGAFTVSCGIYAPAWGLDPSAIQFAIAIDGAGEKGTARLDQGSVLRTSMGGAVFAGARFLYDLDMVHRTGKVVHDRVRVRFTHSAPASLPPTLVDVDLEIPTTLPPPTPPKAPASASIKPVGGASALTMASLQARGITLSLPIDDPGVRVNATATITASLARRLGMPVPKGRTWVPVGTGVARAGATGPRNVVVRLTRPARRALARELRGTGGRRLTRLPVLVEFRLTDADATSSITKSVTFRR